MLTAAKAAALSSSPSALHPILFCAPPSRLLPHVPGIRRKDSGKKKEPPSQAVLSCLSANLIKMAKRLLMLQR